MEQSADKAAMGLRLKRVRKFLGMTQEKMAEILGISDRQYRRYENGTSTPSVSTVMKITGFSDKIDFSYIVSGCSSLEYYIRSGFQRMPEQQLNLILNKSHNIINADEVDRHGLFDIIKELYEYGWNHANDAIVRTALDFGAMTEFYELILDENLIKT